jgi:hypothetical protein
VPDGKPVDGFVTGGFTTLVVGAFGFTASAFAFAATASAFAFVAAAAVFAAVEFAAVPVPVDTFGLLVDVAGLPVNLSISSFVPAPIAAPVSAFTTLLVVELGLLVFGLTVGLTVVAGLVVLVAGVDGVLFVTVGFVVGAVVEVSGVFGAKVVFGVVPVLVVKDVLGAKVVLGAEVGVFIAGFVNSEVKGLPEELLDTDGVFTAPRMMLSNGARSSPLASGSCLLEVRFFRIAIVLSCFLNQRCQACNVAYRA